MPDLVTALDALFDGGDMTSFQATVDAVGTGVVTLHVNGGTFTDVPYIAGGFYPQAAPAINDRCYVIGRKGWGLLVIGRPAAGPVRDPGGDAGTYIWEPTTLGIWQLNPRAEGGGFSVTGTQLTHPADETGYRQAVWFYTSGNPMPIAASLATASLNLGGSWSSTDQTDWDYVEIGLHGNLPSDPPGYLNKLANLSQTYRFPRTFALSYYSIPLDWIGRLINGTAKGIYAEAQDYPLTFTGSGELRLTTL
jgi:hypothetical protein